MKFQQLTLFRSDGSSSFMIQELSILDPKSPHIRFRTTQGAIFETHGMPAFLDSVNSLPPCNNEHNQAINHVDP